MIQAFLDLQAKHSVSYAEVGASEDGAPVGFDLDHNRVELGTGRQVFEAACGALEGWRHFPSSWTQIYPHDAPLETGRNVAMLARALGFWWLNACRIVYVIDETAPVRRYGFAYGTLPGHVESGEERFTIRWDQDDRVWYDIRAFSRPRYLPVRLCYPLARRLQRRFVADSQRAMIESTSPAR